MDRALHGINLESLFLEHREKIKDIYNWFREAVHDEEKNDIKEYIIEYRTIRKEGSKIWWNLIIQTVIVQWGKDPYDYLERYFSTEEIERIQVLPERSRQQVDLMISLLDEFDACDDDFRQSLYEAFRVRVYLQ
jgi:hypothetical protein